MKKMKIKDGDIVVLMVVAFALFTMIGLPLIFGV